jgi:uncharacterized protein YecT (DUF1311 family)
MQSLAAQHRVKVEAGRQDRPDSLPTDNRVNDQYRVHLFRLKADHKRLAAIKSQARRLDVKREILTQYRDYLDGVLSLGTTSRSGQDSVLVWCALWAADVGDIPNAVKLATCAIQRGMTAPDGFTRSLPEIVTEEISKAVLAAHPADYLLDLQTLCDSVEGLDMSDTITAKLNKAYGLALAGTDPAQAARRLQTAQTLKPNIGVKAHLKKLKGDKPMATTTDTAKRYDLPTKQAALTVGVSIPTFLKLAALNAAELPYICFESGKHKSFRFCQRDVEKFLQKRTHGGAAA